MAPYGLKIELAASGFDALEKIKEGKEYDIIFMDHMMPEMDGIEATKKIREAGYKKPVIALTANAVSGASDLFLKNGFDAFISKPIDIRQLNTVLKKFVRSKPKDPALLAIFAKDAKKALPILESMEDLRLFVVNAHAMKSALANIGEREASKQAEALEKAGKEQNANLMQTETPKFVNALKSIIAKIEEEEAENAAGADEDPAYLREQLQIISKACAEYDDQSVNAALANLQKMKWTKETKAKIDQIAEFMLFSDFEAAGEKAGLLQQLGHSMPI
jgi:CheY-like chemotaxis protein